MKTLCREPRLLFAKMRGNGGCAGEGFCLTEAVVKAPEKVRRDDLVERIHIALEQGARKTLEQGVSLGGRWIHDWRRSLGLRSTKKLMNVPGRSTGAAP